MLFIFILISALSFHPTLFHFTFHVGCSVESSCYFLPSFFFFFCLIKPPENSSSVWRCCRSKTSPPYPGGPFRLRIDLLKDTQQKCVKIISRGQQGHSKTPTVIISWPPHLKRRLKLVPRAEANVWWPPLLQGCWWWWKLPCAANPGLFGLGDKKRQALINCVWWWVCKCVYWKYGSVIVTTLATTSYLVGLAGTKANKKCKSFKKSLQKSLKSNMNVAVRTQEVQRDNSGRRGPWLLNRSAACWRSDTDPPAPSNKQPENRQLTDAGAFRAAKNSSYGILLWWESLDLGGRESQSDCFSLLTLDPICPVVGHISPKWT